MDWKKLLEHLKDNVQYLTNIQYILHGYDLEFNYDHDKYWILLRDSKIIVSYKGDVWHTNIFSTTLSSLEYAEATLLVAEISKNFDIYHTGKINQFINTKKIGPKSIEELDDNGNND